MYIPLSSGLRKRVMRCPDSVSVIFGLLGEMLYPLETLGAKSLMLCEVDPLIERDAMDESTCYKNYLI